MKFPIKFELSEAKNGLDILERSLSGFAGFSLAFQGFSANSSHFVEVETFEDQVENSLAVVWINFVFVELFEFLIKKNYYFHKFGIYFNWEVLIIRFLNLIYFVNFYNF